MTFPVGEIRDDVPVPKSDRELVEELGVGQSRSFPGKTAAAISQATKRAGVRHKDRTFRVRTINGVTSVWRLT